MAMSDEETSNTTVTIDDPHHGEMTATRVPHRSVTVVGDAVPQVRITRIDGSEVSDVVPVGTRVPDHLSLAIDGQPAELVPRPGRLTRRSFRIRVRAQGSAYLLQPTSMAGSRLWRDGHNLGEIFIQDGLADADWEPGAHVAPQDAALGYALATAFGTGSQPAWMIIPDLIGGLTPG